MANLRGEFVYANLAACELFGYPCDEFLNLNLWRILQIPEEEKKNANGKNSKSRANRFPHRSSYKKRESSDSFAYEFSEDGSWKADNQRSAQG